MPSVERVRDTVNSRSSLGGYVVGVYLFSVPAFAYAEASGLSVIPQAAGALLVGYALFDILRGQRIKIPVEIGLYGLMGLLAVTTYVLAASSNEWESLGTLIKVVTATLACAQLIKDEDDLLTALKIFAVSVVFVYIQNRQDLQYLRIADRVTDADRFAGTMANANNAAMYALTVIWASLLVLWRSGRRIWRWAWLLIPVGISLLIIYYSGSKKGLVGVALFVVFLGRLLYLSQRSSFFKRILIVLTSFILIIGAGYFIFVSPFFFRVQQLVYGESGSDFNRYYLAKEAVHVWLTNWKTFFIGVGYDQFRSFSGLQAYAHSTPFELVASNGLLGLSLFMAFLTLLARKFVVLYRGALDQGAKIFYFLALLFLSYYSLFMLAAVLHDSRELLPIIGGLAAIAQVRFYEMKRASNPA